MMSFRRVMNENITSFIADLQSVMQHLHWARAYRPVSQKMMPRWRNIGTAITPYHFMRPAVVPAQKESSYRNIR